MKYCLSYFTWDSLVLLQEAQGRCTEENLQARLGIKPATSRLVITHADQLASAHLLSQYQSSGDLIIATAWNFELQLKSWSNAVCPMSRSIVFCW